MESLGGNAVSINSDNINLLIQQYMKFMIKTVSEITGRYVSVENDDEMSIALIAFKEAVDKYDEEKGNFSSYAKLVISSRLKSYLVKENKHKNVDYIEDLKEAGIDVADIYEEKVEDTNDLADEIDELRKELIGFGFSFEDLVDEAPKHVDTRNRAIDISKRVTQEKDITSYMYEKKKLPIRKVSSRLSITEKIIKRSKKFIISVVIILDKNFRNIRLWIGR